MGRGTVHVALEIQLGREPLSGRLLDEGGRAHDFSSWLGLIDALEAISSRSHGRDGEAEGALDGLPG